MPHSRVHSNSGSHCYCAMFARLLSHVTFKRHVHTDNHSNSKVHSVPSFTESYNRPFPSLAHKAKPYTKFAQRRERPPANLLIKTQPLMGSNDENAHGGRIFSVRRKPVLKRPSTPVNPRDTPAFAPSSIMVSGNDRRTFSIRRKPVPRGSPRPSPRNSIAISTPRTLTHFSPPPIPPLPPLPPGCTTSPLTTPPPRPPKSPLRAQKKASTAASEQFANRISGKSIGSLTSWMLKYDMHDTSPTSSSPPTLSKPSLRRKGGRRTIRTPSVAAYFADGTAFFYPPSTLDCGSDSDSTPSPSSSNSTSTSTPPSPVISMLNNDDARPKHLDCKAVNDDGRPDSGCSFYTAVTHISSGRP